MRFRMLLALVIAILTVSGCQGGPPPTLLVMEVTREVTIVVTADPNASPGVAVPTPGPLQTSTSQPTPSTTPTLSAFPTPVVGQVYVAEQPFENGRMLWLQPVQQIWVISTNDEGENVWSVYDDTFEEGQVERDPSIVAPDDLYQPERGFGKLWRENPEVQAIVGWATEPEFGYATRYEYHAGGNVNPSNEYTPGPGYHLMETLNREIIRFNESDRSWSIEPASSR